MMNKVLSARKCPCPLDFFRAAGVRVNRRSGTERRAALDAMTATMPYCAPVQPGVARHRSACGAADSSHVKATESTFVLRLREKVADLEKKLATARAQGRATGDSRGGTSGLASLSRRAIRPRRKSSSRTSR